MRIRFLGGVRTVTGSMHLVETEGGSLLLECGLFQGRREEANARNRSLPGPARQADAVLLSHAHIDHSGALPMLVKGGWKGPIHLTAPTAELADLMLRDSGAIQEKDAEFLNKHRKNGQEAVQPLYSPEDAVRAAARFRPHAYGEEFEPVPGTTARFADAGHILGSAVIHLTVREKAGTTRLLFTGDLGRSGMPLLRDPEPAGPAEVILTESTYGDRDHEPPEDTERRLFEVVDRTVRRGGRVIVPCFAVGRAQAVIYLLHRLRSAGKILDVPIFVDSPMAVEATRIFAAHQDLFDAEAREFVQGRGPLFSAARTRYVSEAAESRALNDLAGPAVVLSASGMCEAGRILHHLRHGLGDPRNTVLFVGYQAEHTLGRRILEKQEEVRVFGEMHRVRAEVAKVNGLSAHADRGGIAAYIRSLGGKPKRVFLVHGDLERCESLKAYLAARGMHGAEIPEIRQRVDLADCALKYEIRPMRFTKLEGCGNDYLFVDCTGGKSVRDPEECARRISDRRFGVGSDGLILITDPPKGGDADLGMTMYNADGSASEMCGNGFRGLCKYAYEHGLVKKESIRVMTGAGLRTGKLHLEGGKVGSVTVDMGEPGLNRGDVPMEGPSGPAIDVLLRAAGRELSGTAVSMGNPHFVVFVDGDVDAFPVAEVGPAVEHHTLFPHRANAEFVQVLGKREVRQRTWERGSGETLACGTGAAAVLVAGIVTGRLESPLVVHLRGGDLRIEWAGKGHPVFKTGPSIEVFSGEYPW